MKKKPLTKGDELQVIDVAIIKLGTDSYLGPWLTQIRSELIRDLRSDILPTISLDDAAKQADEIVKRAASNENQILRTAQIEAG
jgi:hypothetical protein